MAFENEDYNTLQIRYSDILKNLEYIECDIGWFDIIDKCLSDILKICYEAGASVQIVQIKEKFGGLRFYTKCDSLHERISEAEVESYATCQKCGKPGKARNFSGWISTVCEEHSVLD